MLYCMLIFWLFRTGGIVVVRVEVENAFLDLGPEDGVRSLVLVSLSTAGPYLLFLSVLPSCRFSSSLARTMPLMVT